MFDAGPFRSHNELVSDESSCFVFHLICNVFLFIQSKILKGHLSIWERLRKQNSQQMQFVLRTAAPTWTCWLWVGAVQRRWQQELSALCAAQGKKKKTHLNIKAQTCGFAQWVWSRLLGSLGWSLAAAAHRDTKASLHESACFVVFFFSGFFSQRQDGWR